MILTIEEHIERYNQYPDYLRRLAEPYYSGTKHPNNAMPQIDGMIKWNDNDACSWAGPFDGNYAFFKIIDYNRQYPGLKSIAEIKEQEKTYVKYSCYSWPHGYVDKILGKDWNLCYVGDTLCGRQELTNIELHKVETNNPNITTDYLYNCIEKARKLEWHKETPSKETPIRFYMCGTDDCSYTKLLRSMDEAKEYLAYLEINNNFDTIYRDFVFTN